VVQKSKTCQYSIHFADFESYLSVKKAQEYYMLILSILRVT